MATPRRASSRLTALDFQLMRVDTPRDGSQAHTSTAAQQLGSSDGRKQRSSEKKIGKHFALACLCEDSRCVEIRNAHIVGHQTVALDKEPRHARAQVYAVADMVNCGNPDQLTEQRCEIILAKHASQLQSNAQLAREGKKQQRLQQRLYIGHFRYHCYRRSARQCSLLDVNVFAGDSGKWG